MRADPAGDLRAPPSAEDAPEQAPGRRVELPDDVDPDEGERLSRFGAGGLGAAEDRRQGHGRAGRMQASRQRHRADRQGERKAGGQGGYIREYDWAGNLIWEHVDPEEAAEFVKATGVDALAIACGTSHGAYKFTRPPTGDILAIDRIKDINSRIPNTHLVMHGSSSVPQDWLAIINQYGGEIPETYGVPLEQIQEGIRHGVRKVNIDTDLRLASTGAIRRFLARKPSEFDPRKYLAETIVAMRDICIERYEAFGTAGNAGKIKVKSLAAMQLAYDAGELNQRVN